MGNVNSYGLNNDHLIDRLRLLGYINTKEIELAFRAVDRGDYILPDNCDKNGIYKDLSWKVGNIHLSAPCVYATVMEALSLQSDSSFLNIGSGTGYLSTVAGLILNSYYATNHGIEVNKDCVEYAYEKLDEFKKKSHALDQFTFCEPLFVYGDICKIVPNRKYDRVYCGAECPESCELMVKQFVKIGGILIMPYKGNLLKIKRVDKDIWRHHVIMPVSFTFLLVPKNIHCEADMAIQLPLSQPSSLQNLCRTCIRNKIRRKLWLEIPELEIEYPISSICGTEKYPNGKIIEYDKSSMNNKSESGILLLHNTKNEMIVTNTLIDVELLEVYDYYNMDEKSLMIDHNSQTNKWGIAYSDYATLYYQPELINSNNCIFKPVYDDILYNKNIEQSKIYAFNVNTTLLSYCMRRKISHLPLPLSLSLFVNYNHSFL